MLFWASKIVAIEFFHVEVCVRLNDVIEFQATFGNMRNFCLTW
jgi:hypothetical protein